jgi:hypothetical protein
MVLPNGVSEVIVIDVEYPESFCAEIEVPQT